jgi:hypothetical protein
VAAIECSLASGVTLVGRDGSVATSSAGVRRAAGSGLHVWFTAGRETVRTANVSESGDLRRREVFLPGAA